MSYLADAMQHLGIYYTPARILALGYGSGKTRMEWLIANPPFQGETNMIEIARLDAAYIYRICPTDPLLIERKLNKAGARWTWYAHRDTAGEARRALLEIGKGEGEGK
jgi:hypothetical protein